MRSWSPPSPIPGPIETARTIIRPYRKGDGPRLLDAVKASSELAWLWLPWVTPEVDVDDAIYYVERTVRRLREPDCRDFPMAVIDRDGTTLLGGASLHRVVSKESTAEVGYWLRADRNGQGLCTEAVGALLTAGFTAQDQGGWGFRRITLGCAVDNVASRRVAEKLGLRLERRERAERYGARAANPRYLDTVGFAALADEWDFAAQRAKPGIDWPSSP